MSSILEDDNSPFKGKIWPHLDNSTVLDFNIFWRVAPKLLTSTNGKVMRCLLR